MLQSLPVILMVVFICNQAFAMLPHENSSWQSEVKMAAEHDADHDINRFLWFTAGLGTTAACCLGAYIGSGVAYKITDSNLIMLIPERSLEGRTNALVSL